MRKIGERGRERVREEYLDVLLSMAYVSSDALIHDVMGQHFDAVALPGGMPGATHLAESHELTVCWP